jgi:hypothetical protein
MVCNSQVSGLLEFLGGADHRLRQSAPVVAAIAAA